MNKKYIGLTVASVVVLLVLYVVLSNRISSKLMDYQETYA